MYNQTNNACQGQVWTGYQHNMQYLTEAKNFMNTITGYHDALKKYNDWAQDTSDNNLLNQQWYWLSQRPTIPLNQSTVSFNYAINWQNIPEDLYSVIAHMSSITGWPMESILVASLGYITAALRGRYKVAVRKGWDEPLVLYQFIIAPPGSRKSLVHRLFFEPLDKFQEKLMTDYINNKEQNEPISNFIPRARGFIFRGELKTIVKSNQNLYTGLDVDGLNEDLIELKKLLAKIDLPSEDHKLASPSFLADGVTEKKLIRLMAGAGGGQAILQPEAHTLLRQIMDTKFDQKIFLKSYDMETFYEENMVSKPINVSDPFLNILVFMQNEVAAKFYRNSRLIESGISARFLPFFNLNSQPPNMGLQTHDDSIMDIYRSKIQSMLSQNFTQQKKREIHHITLHPDARQMIENFQQQLYVQSRDDKLPESLRYFTNKLAGSAARIAGVMHAWEHDEPEKIPLAQRAVQTGIEIALLFHQHAQYTFSPEQFLAMNDAKQIAKWISRHGHLNFTSRDVAQFSGVRGNDKIFPALDCLQNHNILTQIVRPSKPRMCLVHPQFLNQYLT